jgi:DNA-binding transcriptional LysR family regulator
MNERLLSPVLSDLHLLTVLGDTRSYTQAAKRLGISKASASARITELERTTGVQLVRRSSRSVALTEAGQRLVEDIQPAFARIEEGFSSTRDVVGQPRGLLRVSAPVAIGRQLVMPLLPEFLSRYPEIRLELELTDRLVNLQQEGFDVAIRHTQSPPETHVAWTLCRTQTLLVASPAYLALHGTPAHPSELSRHQCLPYLRGGGVQRWSFERPLKRKQVQRVDIPVGGPFKANNSELLREAVIAGLGIGLLPDFSCARALHEGLVVTLLDPWRSVGFFGDQIYAIRAYIGAQVPRAVQCFVEHLRKQLDTALAAV